jgi:hypothetical protein
MIRKLFILILLFTQSGVLMAAEEGTQSRTQQLEQQRLQKLQKIEPYRQTGLERDLLWVEQNLDRLLHLNYKGFYPQAGSISTRSGISLGVRYWKSNLGDSPLDLQLSAAGSWHGYQEYSFQLGKIPQAEPGLLLESIRSERIYQLGDIPIKQRGSFYYVDLRYRDFPQEDFFGMGPQSREEDRTNFRLKNASYDAVIGYRFSRWLRIGTRMGFQQFSIGGGTDDRFPDTQALFNETSAPGLTEQPDFFLLRPFVLFDYRDVSGNPHKGGLWGFSFTRFDDVDKNQFDFNRFIFETRQFLPLFSRSQILALRFFTSLSDADEGSRVPFYLQETLGGGDTLRGFPNFRFQDNDLLYLSAEYRFEAASALEFAFFYDTGKVFSDLSDFNFKDLENSYGLGIRIKAPSAVIFRFDVGHSDEGTEFHFKFGSSF